MQLSADEIASIIKQQIQNYDRAAVVSETGTVLTTADGIARVYGLEGVMAGELVEFPGEVYGLVLNLEQDSVGVAILGGVFAHFAGQAGAADDFLAGSRPALAVGGTAELAGALLALRFIAHDSGHTQR